MTPQHTAETKRKAAEVREAWPDPCEYNPAAKRTAYEDEVHGPAEWLVGHDGQWRLCDDCARLPDFKRYKSRGKIR